MNRRTGRLQLPAQGIAIRILRMIGFGMGVGGGVDRLKIAPGQGGFVLRQSAFGHGSGFARREKYCDQRREDGEGEAAKFSVCQRGSPELLTVIHNPWQALFFTFFRQNLETEMW